MFQRIEHLYLFASRKYLLAHHLYVKVEVIFNVHSARRLTFRLFGAMNIYGPNYRLLCSKSRLKSSEKETRRCKIKSLRSFGSYIVEKIRALAQITGFYVLNQY